MSGRKGTLAPEDYIVAAIRHVDEHGPIGQTPREKVIAMVFAMREAFRHGPNAILALGESLAARNR